MPDIRWDPRSPSAVPGALLAVLTGPAGPLGQTAAAACAAVDPDGSVIPTLRAAGRPGAPVLVPTAGRLPVPWLLVVPLEGSTPPAVREAAMAAARRATGFDVVVLALDGATEAADEAVVEAAAEGWVLGSRRFTRYLSKDADRAAEPAGVVLTCARPEGAGSRLDAAVARGRAIGEAADWVRDLVDTPAVDATPSRVADLVGDRARDAGVEIEVIHGEALLEGRYGGLVAVGAASADPPCLVRLAWRGAGAGAPLALVGKGITFDSGGLDLKPSASMVTMKQDMAGAAAVAGAVVGAAELGLAVDVVGYLALAENMPGGAAVRGGDIIRHRDGTTTEVISPDAEGRLVLSDVLVRAGEDGPRAIVDVATLTGGGALGPERWAVLGTDDDLVEALVAAGDRAGEPGWRLPLPDGYERFLESPIADRRNLAVKTRYGFDAIAGALYLRSFVGGVPWAHLDTSAVAARDSTTSDASWAVGATGWPMRALLAWLRAEAAVSAR